MDKLPGKDSRIIGEIKLRHHLPKLHLPKLKHQKPLLIFGICAMLAGAGTYWVWSKGASKNEDQTYQKMITEVDTNLRNGNQGTAKQKLEAYLSDEKPKAADHLYNIEIRLGVIYRNISDYKNARMWAEKSLDHTNKPTLDTYMLLADSSERLNDNKAAIKYYERAAELLKAQNTVNASAKLNALNVTIKDLKASDKQ